MPAPSVLRSRLSAYSVASKTLTRRRWTQADVYAAAAGATLALTTGASASIIWSGLQNLVLTIPETGVEFNRHVQLTVNLGGTNFFRAKLTANRNTFTDTVESGDYTNTYTYTDQDARAYLRTGASFFTSGGYAQKFAQSSLIGPTGGDVNNAVLHDRSVTAYGNDNTYGYFSRNDSGLVGIRFQRSGQSHYGWVRVKLADTNNNGFVNQLTVVEWAYENDPNTALLAGVVPVPEPGTLSLSLLAMGSAGVIALRRRRQTQEPEVTGSPES